MSTTAQPGTIPIQPVRLLDLATQLQLHRLAWSRTLTLPWPQRLKYLPILLIGPLLAALLALTAAMTVSLAVLIATTITTAPLAQGAATAAAGLLALMLLLAAASAAAGGVPASVALASLYLGRVWTTARRDAVATSIGTGRRRTIGNHFAHGHGTTLRSELVQQLLRAGRSVRFRASGRAVAALYRRELETHTAHLGDIGATVHHIRSHTWELRPGV